LAGTDVRGPSPIGLGAGTGLRLRRGVRSTGIGANRASEN